MKKLITLLIIGLTPFYSFAAYDWSQHGFKVNKVVLNTSIKTIELTDKNGYPVNIKYQNKTDEKYFPRIIQLNERFKTWKLIHLKAVNIDITNDQINFVISPKTFKYKNRDLLTNLPAGLYFTDGNQLRFNFRVVKSNTFIRLKGMFENETALAMQISEAINNPFEYIKKYDPAYFYNELMILKKRTAEFQTKIPVLENSVKNLQVISHKNKKQITNLILQIVRLKIKNEKHTVEKQQQFLSIDKIIIGKILDILEQNPNITLESIKNRLSISGTQIETDVLSVILDIINY